MSAPSSQEIVLNLLDTLRNSAIRHGEAVEQLAHLLYLKLLDEEDELRAISGQDVIFEGAAERYRWRALRALGAAEMAATLRDGVFPYLASLVRKHSHVGDYFRSVTMVIESPSILVEVVNRLSDVTLLDMQLSERGALFDELLAADGSADRGQFSTPIPLRKLLMELTQPTLDDSILDPCCGFGSLLAGAFDYSQVDRSIVSERPSHLLPSRRIRGVEVAWPVARLARLNLIFHGLTGMEITCGSALTNSGALGEEELRRGFSLVLAVPTFGAKEQLENIRPDLATKSLRGELLFLALAMTALAPGGRAAIVVPDGVLFGSTESHIELRKQLVMHHHLIAVISLGEGAFSPSTGIKTSILVFRKPFSSKPAGSDRVWFYGLPSAYPTKRQPCETYPGADDLMRLWTRFANSDFTEVPGVGASLALRPSAPEPDGWWADLDTIKSNSFALIAGRYKPQRQREQVDPNTLRVRLMEQLTELQTAIANWIPSLSAFPSTAETKATVPLAQLIVDVPSFNPAAEPDTWFHYAEISGVDRERHVLIPKKHLQGKDVPPRARRRLRSGDVVISTIRPTEVKAAIVPPEWDGAIASGDLCVLRAEASIVTPEFLLHLCLDPAFMEQLDAVKGGVTLPRVNESQIKSAVVQQPPLLFEQSQLTAPLEQLNRLDGAAANAAESAKALQQAIRDAYFTSHRLTQPLHAQPWPLA